MNHLQNMLSPKSISKVKDWLNDLANMFLFMKTMAIGPVGAHSAALDRGIDSVTIQIELSVNSSDDNSNYTMMEIVQYTLYLIRALSNLHERLHHSVTLYLLPTPRTFVSHMEYFLPNILILLPLAIRAFGLLLPKMMISKTTKFFNPTIVDLIYPLLVDHY